MSPRAAASYLVGLLATAVPAVTLPLVAASGLFRGRSGLPSTTSARWLLAHLWPLLAAVIVLAVPTAATGTLTPSSLVLLPLIAAAVLGRLASARSPAWSGLAPRPLLAGVASALIIAGGAALVSATRVWLVRGVPHENVLAAQLGTVSLLAYFAWRNRPSRLLFPMLGFVCAMALGSRSAALGLLLAILLDAALTLEGAGPGAGHRRRRAWPALGAAVLVAALVAVLPGWRSHMAAVRAAFGEAPAAANLVRASEAIGAAPWSLDGVTVESAGATPAGEAVFRVTKTSGSGTARPQARLLLEPRSEYTVTLAYRAAPERMPGLSAWSPATADETEAVVRVGIVGNGESVVSSSGPLTASVTSAGKIDDGWSELVVLLTNASDARRTVWIGPTPDVRPDTAGATAEFARFAVIAGAVSEPEYTPTFPEPESVITARSRLEIFGRAVAGFRSAPWLGRGHGAFVSDQRLADPDGFAFAHAHDLVLHVAYERGTLGLAGLTLVVFGLVRVPAERRGRWSVVVAAVLAMNLTDMTFWSAGVAVPIGLAYGVVSASLGASGPASQEPRIE